MLHVDVSPVFTCDNGHSLARVLWFISFSSSLRAFLTVAWFHCSQGRSSSFEKLQQPKQHQTKEVSCTIFHQVNKSRYKRTSNKKTTLEVFNNIIQDVLHNHYTMFDIKLKEHFRKYTCWILDEEFHTSHVNMINMLA